MGSEWEQLNNWLQEVERRVERRATASAADGEGTARVDDLQRRWESDRRDWGLKLEEVEREAAHLRELLSRREAGVDLGAVEEENRRLRAACLELRASVASAEDARGLRARLDDALAEIAKCRASLSSAEDEHRRERI